MYGLFKIPSRGESFGPGCIWQTICRKKYRLSTVWLSDESECHWTFSLAVATKVTLKNTTTLSYCLT